VLFANGRHLGLTVFGGRLFAEHPQGEVFTNGKRTHFDGFRTPIDFDGEPVGRVIAQGVYSADADVLPGDTLDLSVSGARIESAIITRAVTERSKTLGAWLDEHSARGRFNIGVERSSETGGELRGWLVPQEFTIDRRGTAVPVRFSEGEIVFGERRGTIDGIVAEIDSWAIGLGGGWTIEDGADVRIEIDAQGDALTDTILAALPEAVAESLGALALDVGKGFEMRGAQLRIRDEPGQTGKKTTRFRGTLGFGDASLRAGLPITHIAGTARLDIYDDGVAVLPDFDIAIDATGLELAGVTVDSGRVRIVSGLEKIGRAHV